MKRNKLSDTEIKVRVHSILKDYLDNPEVLGMKDFIQHGSVSTYDHALSVAYLCYKLAYKNKKADIPLLTVCAFLHDFYLYDWHERDPSHKWHGFHHARRAAENAERVFSIGDRGRLVIMSHMWPLNLTRIPRSREALILTVADKLVSARESISGIFSPKGKR